MLLHHLLHQFPHPPRRVLRSFYVRSELERIERRPLPPYVTVGTPHAEPQGEAPHGGEQLLLADRLGQHLQVRERIGRELPLRLQRGCEQGGHDDETDDRAHLTQTPLVARPPNDYPQSHETQPAGSRCPADLTSRP